MSIDALAVTSVPEAVYEALRERILTQREAPGAAVTEQAVADRFGVARPTAKVALERLVAEGLLRRTAHKTARVPQLSRDDIVDLYANRAIVEEAALRALATRGIVPSEALAAQRMLADAARAAHAPAGSASDRDATAPLARADIAFHRALVEAQPSPRLARMHALLMGEIELCTGQVQAHRLLALADVVEQHQRILDAVAAGDPEAAGRLTRAHIEGARDRLLARYDATRSAPNDEPTHERD
ncbi:GntR family transcriptional regulator [Yonghaparkia sp. Soil809]|uniref:GntR family transcriptional regulator n=1 Tax=Yonghaparkia sp. Soil809 TaxID=1736417 RepID=UPI00070168A2|nr:GntR family transcriptional regulator [Yonghaparkia sp. Soil809]KRF33193.1 GntR family transcriptional regulator [Yonghaparkia sp. Soil809]